MPPGMPPPPPMPGMGPGLQKGPQLRQLHWQKIPPVKVEGTVWNALPTPKGIDEEALKALFTLKVVGLGRKNSATGLVAPKGGGDKKVMLLDIKRSNQIQIALAKFKKSHEEMRDCILSLDEGVIKVEDVNKLKSCVPTAEERELLQPYLPDGEKHAHVANLEAADHFLVLVSQVPRVTQRLDCFQTKLNLPQRITDAMAQIDSVTSAVKGVRESNVLPQLLALVLAAGNVLNAGTLKGNAKGFRLEVLQKLAETKSAGVDGEQTSLLHHLATIAVAQAPDVAKNLKSQLRKVEEASAIKTSVIDAEVGALRRELEAITREMPHVEKAGAADRFHEVMRSFSAQAGCDLDNLEGHSKAMRESLVAVGKFLEAEAAADEPEIVLNRVHAFVTSFGKACRDNERAAFLKKKQKEQEAEKARRAEEAAKGGGAAAGGVGETPPGAVPGLRKLRHVVPAAGMMMSSIQGSLRRGEFKMMKQLQAQMSEELASRLKKRRSSVNCGDPTL